MSCMIADFYILPVELESDGGQPSQSPTTDACWGSDQVSKILKNIIYLHYDALQRCFWSVLLSSLSLCFQKGESIH